MAAKINAEHRLESSFCVSSVFLFFGNCLEGAIFAASTPRSGNSQ
jgi:hypothetical protein